MRTTLLLGVLLCACAEPPPATSAPVPGAAHLALVPDPGPPPLERPPLATLWARTPAGWRAQGRVQAVAPGDAARVDDAGRLLVDGAVVAEAVLPDLQLAPDGTLYFTRADHRPDTDVWRLRRGGTPEPVTTDGRSDRPLPLPDGRLLWVSAAGGVAGFMLDGVRLTNTQGGVGPDFIPVPAHPERSRVEGSRVVYDAGEGDWRWLDVDTGAAGRP
ncbi:MAG: hypothetical protein H6706_25305 [Myxococcales bacterium]|nr:hypothetical protein [Myxococcales bacterium]